MNKLLFGFILIIIGITIGYLTKPVINEIIESSGLMSGLEQDTKTSSDAEKILYWVAPMDANYRRDEPGKSPMGMDLVPVYADEGNNEDGVVKISPTVQNNLGVRVANVSQGKLDRLINTVGYVGFDEEKIFHVHTRVEGWVERLTVKAVGDRIKKGQKLFELYSPDMVNAQEEYLNSLKSKNAMLIKASESRLRFLGIGESQIKALNKTRSIRQRIDYFSKHTGFINELNIREGMFIKPSTDVLSTGQIDTVWVIAEVFELQSSWIKSGQSVDMTVTALPGKTWQGTVDYIYPVLDSKTRTLRVRVRFDNSNEELKPNMYAQLKIRSTPENETLYIPREALIRSGTMNRVVKSLGEGKFLSVAVKPGTENDDYIEILQGLSAEDSIVTSAQFLIDSESSLTASFSRMKDPESSMQMALEPAMENPTQVWVEGEIMDIMPGHNMLTIKHEPVDAWGWPTMVMDFTVKADILLDKLSAQNKIRFLVEKQTSGGLTIIEIEDNKIMSSAMDQSQAWVMGNINSINVKQSKLNLSHGPVEVWGWPSMMMDFPVASSVDISTLKEQQHVQLLVQKNDNGSIQVIQIKQGH